MEGVVGGSRQAYELVVMYASCGLVEGEVCRLLLILLAGLLINFFGLLVQSAGCWGILQRC
jgi:hypothetical protein